MEISNEEKTNFSSLRENSLKLPTDCRKPNLTIQDSYLMFYFGKFNMPKPQSNSVKISNDKNLIKSLEKEILSSNDKDKDLDLKNKLESLNSKVLNEKQEDESLNVAAKLSGKKSKRQYESLDPLEILNTRDKKGNFVKKEKKTLMQLENKDRHNVNDPILDQELDTNLDDESRFESQMYEDNQQKHGELENNIIEEDLLIPASLRYKKKNK